jgi:citrate lyase subunit beta/citryl-CoA lyase
MTTADTGRTVVATAVTALFVPGNRPERFAKAAAAGADVVIMDLEDAVAATEKEGALAAVLEALAPADQNGGGAQAVVRVNAMGSFHYDSEVAALLSLSETPGHGLLGLMVPKAEDAIALGRLSDGLPAGLALVPLVESAAGLLNALELARVPGITRLAFGALDFALDINSATADEFVAYARSHLVVASRAAGIAPPLDSPTTELRDSQRVTASARLARDFGFGGKLCIHPVQVSAVQRAFAPTAADVEWALSVIGAEAGATRVDGQMVDRPVTERARRILHGAAPERK